MLGRGTQPDHPDNPTEKPVEERRHGYPGNIGKVKIRVPGNTMRKVADQVINQAHVVVSIRTAELYPVANKNLVIGEIDSNEKGYSEEESYQYTNN
jgi:hypothetical protein